MNHEILKKYADELKANTTLKKLGFKFGKNNDCHVLNELLRYADLSIISCKPENGAA